jgi:hypothetical protein
MSATSRIKLVSYISLAIGFILIVNAGVRANAAVVRALLGAPGLALMTLGLYDRWVWRLGPIGMPILAGTWKGSLISSWRDPNNPAKTTDPTEVFVVIRQTATSITVTLLSRESRSWSIASSINRSSDGQHEIAWAYRNEPLTSLARRSTMHYGGALIAGVSRRRPMRLEGRYWTERGTTGDIALDGRIDALADGYDEAQRLYAEAGRSSMAELATTRPR